MLVVLGILLFYVIFTFWEDSKLTAFFSPQEKSSLMDFSSSVAAVNAQNKSVENDATSLKIDNEDREDSKEKEFTRTNSTMTSQSDVTSFQENTTVLRPPFQIIQAGNPRTGSTFQYHLLLAIVFLTSPPNTTIQQGLLKLKRINKALGNNSTFVHKTHNFKMASNAASQSENIVVFQSSPSMTIALYTQDQKELLECSICEIDAYRPFFGISDQEREQLQDHMQLWEKLRRCCGWQMSKYQVMRLNGCNMTNHMQKAEYPMCEQYNLTDIELRLVANPIPADGVYGWKEPGDCEKVHKKIADGKGFMGKPFKGCMD